MESRWITAGIKQLSKKLYEELLKTGTQKPVT